MARRMTTVRRVARALVLDLDPTPVELFAAQFSVWIAFVLFTLPEPAKPQPVKLWAAWALVAGIAKVAGIVPSLAYVVAPRWARVVRGVGDFLGIGMWGMLATFTAILTHGHGFLWGGYALMATGQAWAFCRVLRGR